MGNDPKRPVRTPSGRQPGEAHGRLRSGITHAAAPPEFGNTLDPQLALIRALIASRDWRQLKSRVGIDQASPNPQSLPLFIELRVFSQDTANDQLMNELKKLSLDVPEAYFKEREKNKTLARITGRLTLSPGDPSVIIDQAGKLVPLDDQLVAIIKSPMIRRISAAQSHQPCLEQSLQDIGLLPAHGHKGHVLRGAGVMVGIIDDGCAFAHRHFLNVVKSDNGGATYATRVLRLWDQAAPPSATDQQVGWVASSQGYGRELDDQAINAVIAKHVTLADQVEEDAIYAELNYQVGDLGDMASHGTHVMDIAAGNGQSLMGWEGVAPEADIVFVQLPPIDIQNPGPALDKHIVDGVLYILQQAGNQPVVINISFSGYSGAHDGTSDWVAQIDALLALDNRAVVVSAGNGFEAECHAAGTLLPGQDRSLGWLVKPIDPTPNDVEIWYGGAAALTVSLTEPETGNVYGPYPLGADEDIAQPSDGSTIGHVTHSQPQGVGGDKTVLIAMQPTDQGPYAAGLAPARSGIWEITLKEVGGVPADFHAWIRRDDIGWYVSRRQQSRFVPQDAYPGYTIGDFATGLHTISVGAYNTGTQEVARYSACGPTRPSAHYVARRKPDLCAPAAEDAAGRGVLAASSLRAQPTRFGGTSASAPHVTGLVALVLEYATQYGAGSINCDTIRDALVAAANKAALKYNAHQDVDADFQIKQRDVWADLIGGGKVDFGAAMNLLFP